MNILSKLSRLFFKKKIKPSGPVDVVIINPGEKYIYDALGITEQRLQELSDHGNQALQSCFTEGKGLRSEDLLREISLKCVHPNELALLCYVVGRSVGATDVRNEMSQKLFGQ